MGELVHTDILEVDVGVSEDNTLIVHPHEGKKIDILTSKNDFNLYISQEEFIQGKAEFKEITLKFVNDYTKGDVKITNQLRKKLDYPGQVKLFRKHKNLFIKSLD